MTGQPRNARDVWIGPREEPLHAIDDRRAEHAGRSAVARRPDRAVAGDRDVGDLAVRVGGRARWANALREARDEVPRDAPEQDLVAPALRIVDDERDALAVHRDRVDATR